MPEMTVFSHRSSATEEIGRVLSKILRPGDILALDGDLGAGKTVLTRGIAMGLGLTSPVASPTFMLVSEHKAQEKNQYSLYHFDVYRLRDGDDFCDAGLEEYFSLGGICVIEWGEVIHDVLSSSALHMNLKGTGDTREITFSFPEERSHDLAGLSEELAHVPDISFEGENKDADTCL